MRMYSPTTTLMNSPIGCNSTTRAVTDKQNVCTHRGEQVLQIFANIFPSFQACDVFLVPRYHINPLSWSRYFYLNSLLVFDGALVHDIQKSTD